MVYPDLQEMMRSCVLPVMRLSIAAVILLLTGVAHTGEVTDATLNRLLRTDRFAFGRVGYAGVISQGEKDYRAVLSRPTALVDFEQIYAYGNPQAKSYALIGIRKFNLKRFREPAATLRRNQLEVVSQRGCIILHESLASILHDIENGRY